MKAPESADCVVRAPYVGDPTITKRRLAAGLASVYSSLPCYTRLTHHDYGDHGGGASDDVIDVEVQEVRTPENTKALPSPTAEDEAALWERWLSGSHRRQEKK